MRGTSHRGLPIRTDFWVGVGGVYGLLDVTPKGRNEPPGTNLSNWVRHHDKYEEKSGDSGCHG
jgi:predicted dithiol-disulfide oxidoreductase (DUF899 family)